MLNNLFAMEDTHANPLYFHDATPSPFVTIRGDPTGQESRPLSSFGYTDPFHARDMEEEDSACVTDRRRGGVIANPPKQENEIKGRKGAY